MTLIQYQLLYKIISGNNVIDIERAILDDYRKNIFYKKLRNEVIYL